MNFDDLLLGLLGAAIAVYIFKQQAIPEFRPLFDITDQVKEALDLRERIKQRRDHLDAKQERGRDEQLNNYTARLDQLEKSLHASQIVSRTLGIILYVGLGGVVAGFLTGSIEINGVSKEFEAVVIGASWTSYLAGFGLRSELGKVANLQSNIEATNHTVEQATKEVERKVREAASAAPGSNTADQAATEVSELMDKLKGEVREDLVVAQT